MHIIKKPKTLADSLSTTSAVGKKAQGWRSTTERLGVTVNSLSWVQKQDPRQVGNKRMQVYLCELKFSGCGGMGVGMGVGLQSHVCVKDSTS